MITIVKQNYSENKKLYHRIEEILRKDLDDNIPITHVGSTAIPDMYGKNIIDIVIGAVDKKQFEEITLVLVNQGFVPSKKSKDEIYQFFSSTDAETTSGDIHIHLVNLNTERYLEFIILKDYLLSNKEEALNYSNLKKELVDDGITDRKQYKTVKSEYVTKLLERAKAWYSERRGLRMYKIKQMNTEIGKEISKWKYEGEYAIYNLGSYDVLKERGSGITVEKRWKNYYCFFNKNSDELIAYLNIIQKPSGDVFLGIGVKPEYCGKGLGKDFLRYGVNKAKEIYPDNKITLEVRSWNSRAIKCYQNIGFKVIKSIMKEDYTGQMTEYILMEYN